MLENGLGRGLKITFTFTYIGERLVGAKIEKFSSERGQSGLDGGELIDGVADFVWVGELSSFAREFFLLANNFGSLQVLDSSKTRRVSHTPLLLLSQAGAGGSPLIRVLLVE